MANPIELTGMTLLEQLKSTESINDDLLLALPNVFPSSMVAEAAKLVDGKKIQFLVSKSGRKVFKFYTDWMNNEFRLSWQDYFIEDLVEDIGSGVYLVLFVNALFDEDLPLIHLEPDNLLERKQNIEPCLFVLHAEGVNLTGVDVNGLARGNTDVIITLCSAIKRRKGVGFRRWNLFSNDDVEGDEIDDKQWARQYHDKSINLATNHYGADWPNTFSNDQSNLTDITSSQSKPTAFPIDQSTHGNDFYFNQSKSTSLPFNQPKIKKSDNNNNQSKSSTVQSKSPLLAFNQSELRMSDSINQSRARNVSFLLNESLAGTDGGMGCILYCKEDIELFEWVSQLLNVPVQDYGSFCDGILLYQLLNKIIPSCIVPKVFYSLPKADRVKMLLETACHELYLTTELTAGDIVHQNNFGSFRVFLAFLKRRVLSLSVMARDSVAEKERQRRQRFSLNRLTNSYQDEINKEVLSTVSMPNNKSSPENLDIDKRKTITTTTTKGNASKERDAVRTVRRPKKILPTVRAQLDCVDNSVPKVRAEFVSPTWSKILSDELKLRALQNNETGGESFHQPRVAKVSPIITQKGRKASFQSKLVDIRNCEQAKQIPDTTEEGRTPSGQSSLMGSDNRDTKPKYNPDNRDTGPKYNPDNDRITKYDHEIAAVFHQADGSDQSGEDCDDFDLSSLSLSARHSQVSAAAVEADNKDKLSDISLSSTTDMSTNNNNVNDRKKKFLHLTDVVRSMSKSPSGSRNPVEPDRI